MATVNLGRVKPIWRGKYDPAFPYQPLDFLSHSGSLFFCIADSQGNLPTDPTYFQPVVDPNVLSSIDYWADLTGPMTRPAMTYHNGDYWMLTTDLADVTTAEPGVSESWERISQDDLGILTPSIVNPADGTEGFYGTVTSSTYQTGPRFSGSHNKSIFQASTVADFSVIYAEQEITEAPLTEWDMPVPDPLTRVWVRVRYESLENSSYWSAPVEVVIANYQADPPTFIAPTANETGWMPGSTLQISAYSPNLTDTHVATSWEIKNAGGTVVWQSLEDTANLTSIVTPDTVFSAEAAYTVRARHIGQFFGEQDWSDPVSFTTSAAPEPTNQSPADLATGVYPGATLTASAMPAGFVHEASQWRVIRVSDGQTIHDSGETGASLTSYTLPNNLFDPETAYDWQVRYRSDIYGMGPWSALTRYTTEAAPVPTNQVPTDGATGIWPYDPLTASAMPTGFTHTASQWRVIRVSDGVTVHDSGETTVSLTSYAVPNDVVESTSYEWQVRYKTAEYGMGLWSTATAFTTDSSFIPDFETQIGDPYGGGYVAGKIVSDHDGLTYGLVVSDGGGDSAKTGAGSMVWGPLAAVSTTHGVPPMTLADGRANHDAVLALNDLASYPAFKWIEDTCNAGAGLNGHTDWYLPSRDELEILYRNFKPTTQNNNTNTRPTSGFGGDGLTYGTNANSVPAGAGYTLSAPSKTAQASFQASGADALLDSGYWSSTEFDDSAVFFQNAADGMQLNVSKNGGTRVRAVRRVAL